MATCGETWVVEMAVNMLVYDCNCAKLSSVSVCVCVCVCACDCDCDCDCVSVTVCASVISAHAWV